MEIFIKTREGPELYIPVRRLIFALLFWFLSAGFLFLFSSFFFTVTVQLWYWCGGGSRKKRLRLKGWTVAAMSGAIAQRVADTGQAFASLPASGAGGGGQRAVRNERRWTAHVEVEGWRVFLLFPAKTMTARSALHEATALIARAKRRQIK